MQRYYYCFSVYAQRDLLFVCVVFALEKGALPFKSKRERDKNFFPRARRAIALFVFVILATRRFILSLSLSVCVSFSVCTALISSMLSA
jgi:hypothetical protein